MKLSEYTINILKNFSSINPSILVKPGNVLSTVSVKSGGIFASAIVEEEFPQQFAIYKLPEFLGIISLFKDPTFDFEKGRIKITEGKQRIYYTMADESAVVAPPANKTIKLPSEDIAFDLSSEELQRLIKAASILQLPSIAVKGDGQKTTLAAADAKNATANEFSIDVGQTDKHFNMILNVENIVKLIHNNYRVSISSKGISRFVNKDGNSITYYVANEAGSNFEG